MPVVSVIMPTYNRAWIIERAIQSVLAQTLQDFELVVIDDGSTNTTLEQLRQIQDQRLEIPKRPSWASGGTQHWPCALNPISSHI